VEPDQTVQFSCVRNVSRSLSYDFQDRISSWSDEVQTGDGICPADAIGSLAAGFTYVDGTDLMASQVVSDATGNPLSELALANWA
jgi:hypothetical protein